MSDERTENEIFRYIKKEKMVWKFKFYGFFKNLQFFEPYILLIFLNWGLSFFEIGILLTIREFFTYVFEIPSGILADKYGKKNELLVCFIFYIISFIFYFLGPGWVVLIFGSIFFGLGESFRSGTHKAMELQWMERTNLLKYKAYVYGKTRAWSLYGSALNSVLAILIILIVPVEKWIFLLATIPFILDFILISSYPKYLNSKVKEIKEKWYLQFVKDFKEIFNVLKDQKLRKGVFSSATFDGIFKSLKDFIQPIMKNFILIMLLTFSLGNSQEDFYLKLILGMIYALIYIISSIASRNAYFVIQRFHNEKRTIDFLFNLFAFTLILIAIVIRVEVPLIIIILYIFIYAIYNLRRPILVGYIGDLTPKDKRASILSVESQLKSIILFFLAPIIGLIIDFTSIEFSFIILATVILFFNNVFLRGEPSSSTEK